MSRFALLALLLAAASARADWPAGGKLVMTPYNSGHATVGARFLDHPSGDLLLLGMGNGGLSNGFSVQRLRRSGDLAVGWPAVGEGLGWASIATPTGQQGFAVDDSGNVWHGFPSSPSGGSTLRPALQLVSGDALYSPSPFSGVWSATSAPFGYSVDLAAGPAGSIYVAFDGNRLQRFGRNGAVATGWPANGIVGPGGGAPAIGSVVEDGSGGAVVFNLAGLSATRIDSNAVRHAGWPAAGLVLSSDPDVAWFDYRVTTRLFPSGSDHYVVVWISRPASSTAYSIHMQRFGLDGTLDPAWPVDGLEAVAPDTLDVVTPVPDGQGGCYLLWLKGNLPRATHVLPSGVFAPGLDGHGVSPLPPDAQYTPATCNPNGAVQLLNLVADHTSDGGLLFAYDDLRLSPTVSYRVRWLRSDLTPDPARSFSEATVIPAGPHATPATLRAVKTDADGGAFVAWQDYHELSFNQFDFDLWMTKVAAPGLLGVGPPVPRSSALALSVPRPNPSRGSVSFDVTLPDDSPASLELLDIAGRVQRTQSMQGAGPHDVAFTDAGSLAPGLYFARVSSRAGARSVRLVVAR